MQKFIPLRRMSFFTYALIALFVFISTAGHASASLLLTASVPNIRFTTWPIGTTPFQNETLVNRGTSSVKITQATVSGQFAVTNLTLPLTLPVGKSITFVVRFKPTSTGSQTGKLTVVSNAPTVTILLAGTGTAAETFSISPTNYSFGNVTVGQTVAKAATLKAGNTSVVISSATTTNPEFSLGGFKLPLTLRGGQSLSISINFKPASSGATTAQIALFSSQGKISVTAALSGSGVAVRQHEVNMTWSPSQSSVAGYNIYRGTSTGGPYSKLNSQGVVTTSFTDSTVNSGKTYFYVSTAVDSKGVESVKSNEVKAIIPSP